MRGLSPNRRRSMVATEAAVPWTQRLALGSIAFISLAAVFTCYHPTPPVSSAVAAAATSTPRIAGGNAIADGQHYQVDAIDVCSCFLFKVSTIYIII